MSCISASVFDSAVNLAFNRPAQSAVFCSEGHRPQNENGVFESLRRGEDPREAAAAFVEQEKQAILHQARRS
jgi:hypothetical protein